MILVSGTRGPGFDSRTSPIFLFMLALNKFQSFIYFFMSALKFNTFAMRFLRSVFRVPESDLLLKG